jgi:hypothetical protein
VTTRLETAGALAAVVAQAAWVLDPPRLATSPVALATRVAALGLAEIRWYFRECAPRMHSSFSSIPFYAPEEARHDVVERLQRPLAAADLPPGGRPVFVLLPERADELRWVRERHPRGALAAAHRAGQEEPLLLFYRPAPERAGVP